MASSLPSTTDCCTPCDGEASVQVPGPKGDAGSNGSNGSNGVDAFTTTTAQFTMPAEGADVSVAVVDSTWMTPNQKVYVQNAGYMEVRSKSSSTEVTLRNVENTGNSEYTENVAPSTVIASSSQISPAGIQGPAGIDGSSGASTANSYWTRTSEADLSSESAIDALSNGVLQHTAGTPAQAPLCTAVEGLGANGLVTRTSASTAQPRTITGTAGEITVSNGNGVSGNPTLSLHGNVYRSGGTDVAIADGGTGASTAAGARTNLDLDVATSEYFLYRQEETTGTDGGTFTSGAWQTVPINTETVDSGSLGSIASNEITLPSGTYRYRFGVVGIECGLLQGRLWNVTDAAVITNSYGTIMRADTTAASSAEISPGEGRFTLSSSKTIRLEARCSSTKMTNGFGAASSFGGPEVYSFIEFMKEAG